MAFDQIQHIFVLMLENRSFDHLLGFSEIRNRCRYWLTDDSKWSLRHGNQWQQWNGRNGFSPSGLRHDGGPRA